MNSQPVALITGASTGIGLATAKTLLERGMFVILTARESSLSRFHNDIEFLRQYPNHWLRPLDVTRPMDRRTLIEEIERDLGRLDVLVNNAGITYRTPLEYAYEFESKDQMLVNFHAPIELVKVCLPLMRRQGHGHIINISSAAGFFSVPTMGLYAASKHALEGASEALYHELRPWNVRVTVVQPGFVSTDAYGHTRLGLAVETGKKGPAVAYESQSRTVSALVENALRLTTATPEDVAHAIWKVIKMKRPPLRCKVTLDAQVFGFLKKFLPERMFERLVSHCLDRLTAQIQSKALNFHT
jgi:short-subunit dehydrogenase